jgi:hypothetical protein
VIVFGALIGGCARIGYDDFDRDRGVTPPVDAPP